MRQKLIFIGVALLIGVASSFLSSCNSCSDPKKCCDTSSLPGVYQGEATVVVPSVVESMIPPEVGGKSLIPDGPIPCKIEIKCNEKNELTMELVDFKMPVEGVTYNPAQCRVTQTEKIFNLEGQGDVTYGGKTLVYTHTGKIENDSLGLEATITVIPGLVEVKTIFKGRKI